MGSRNLTQLESLALQGECNVADAHPRQSLTPSQRQIIEAFSDLFEVTLRRNLADIELETQESFFSLLGQSSAPIGSRILTCYSSSVAIDILARCLAARGRAHGLIHPTFDNIPALLSSRHIALTPLEEEDLLAEDFRLPRGLASVFVTTPNNPTGRYLTEEALHHLADSCADQEVVLVLDTSFRGFEPEAQYDCYRILADSGCHYAVIEDTGKLWPTSELKVGFLVSSASLHAELERAFSDVLLSVSPFILAIVTEFARDAASGGLRRLQNLVAANRRLLAVELLQEERVELVDSLSRVSVARVRLAPDLSAEVAWAALRHEGVFVLPCGPFHWAHRPGGDRFIRIALARNSEVAQFAGRKITSWISRHEVGASAAVASQG